MAASQNAADKRGFKGASAARPLLAVAGAEPDDTICLMEELRQLPREELTICFPRCNEDFSQLTAQATKVRKTGGVSPDGTVLYLKHGDRTPRQAHGVFENGTITSLRDVADGYVKLDGARKWCKLLGLTQRGCQDEAWWRLTTFLEDRAASLNAPAHLQDVHLLFSREMKQCSCWGCLPPANLALGTKTGKGRHATEMEWVLYPKKSQPVCTRNTEL